MSTLQTVVSRGTRAGQPAASSVPIGSLYFVTDENKNERSNGTTWDSFSSTHPLVQVIASESAAVATGTTTTPFDDTIPQITEGTEFITATITPTNTNNTLLIEAVLVVSSSLGTAHQVTAALHQDSAANALAAVSVYSNVATGMFVMTLRHKMAAGTTSATTFRMRVGASSASTITFNGQSGGRIYGGVAASTLTVTEIAA